MTVVAQHMKIPHIVLIVMEAHNGIPINHGERIKLVHVHVRILQQCILALVLSTMTILQHVLAIESMTI